MPNYTGDFYFAFGGENADTAMTTSNAGVFSSIALDTNEEFWGGEAELVDNDGSLTESDEGTTRFEAPFSTVIVGGDILTATLTIGSNDYNVWIVNFSNYSFNYIGFGVIGGGTIPEIENEPDGEYTGGQTFSNITNISSTPVAALCFLKGTSIDTPDGEVAVETLQIGDLVRTGSTQCAPVKWIGRQTVMTRFQPADRLMPVRFAAGSLGDGLPHTDLTVTSDHAMLVDGVLCHAGALVNGTTINWVPLAELDDSVTYYHVETENHDVILAEGAAAETFIDYLDRCGFDNYQEYLDLYGAERVIHEMPLPRISAGRLVPGAIKALLGSRAPARPNSLAG